MLNVKRFFLSGLLLGAVTAQSNITSTCDLLSAALPNKVFFPEAPVYNASISSYPFIQLRLDPTCIVRPNATKDVVIALGVLTKNNRTRFAVKGGGHNANAGFNNIQNGVTIDMQSLNKVEVALGDKVVRAGAGALGQDLYDASEKRNLTVLGPRIGVVGSAGFLTGGGISFLSPKHGWACDSIVNFEVVLASGEVVNANATSNKDLYAALKGGQNNFGIVTRFDLETFQQGPIWGGRTVYAPQAATDLLAAFTTFKNPKNYDDNAAGWVTIRYNHTAASFTPVSIMWYTKPAQKPGALAPIFNVQPQVLDGKVEAPISEHTRNASRQVKAASTRTIWATTTFHISPTIVHKIHALWRGLVPEILETFADAKPSSEMTFQALPPPPANGTSVNSFGIVPTKFSDGKDLVFLQIVFAFEDPSVTEALYKALKDIIEKVDEITQEEGVGIDYKYLNFAAWFQDPLGSYGKQQKKTLRDVARKFDPKGVFQKQVPGGFKLF